MTRARRAANSSGGKISAPVKTGWADGACASTSRPATRKPNGVRMLNSQLPEPRAFSARPAESLALHSDEGEPFRRAVAPVLRMIVDVREARAPFEVRLDRGQHGEHDQRDDGHDSSQRVLAGAGGHPDRRIHPYRRRRRHAVHAVSPPYNGA